MVKQPEIHCIVVHEQQNHILFILNFSLKLLNNVRIIQANISSRQRNKKLLIPHLNETTVPCVPTIKLYLKRDKVRVDGKEGLAYDREGRIQRSDIPLPVKALEIHCLVDLKPICHRTIEEKGMAID